MSEGITETINGLSQRFCVGAAFTLMTISKL
jgi:hypothetical protein